MNKILIVCGATATGKTKFGLALAKEFDGEIISADSRQVYKEMNILTGKDLPINSVAQTSDLKWGENFLTYYVVNYIKVWMYDVVNPDQEFSVSHWRGCVELIIQDILKRGKLPIVVGGTGLYIKSLTSGFDTINIPMDKDLRDRLEKMDAQELFDYLKSIDKSKAVSMNDSDKRNPRRLIRAIEIVESKVNIESRPNNKYDFLSLGLTISKENLFENIEKKIDLRIMEGAEQERLVLKNKYSANLPSMKIPGMLDTDTWKLEEKKYAKRQLTWFKKQVDINWFEINELNWEDKAKDLVKNWYN